MKKALLFVATLFTVGAIMAQLPVSREVEQRNVILEEFTGVGCGYCPDGHAYANQVCSANAGHAWAINIHTGGYANGSGYTTPEGDYIASLFASEITGYPCGTVNRGNIQNRGQWAGTANSIRDQNSPVNVAAEATIDPITRQMTVNVEVYYTGTQNVNSNYLHVALIQNNIIGPQINYGNYNQSYIMPDGTYRHMHMLRHLLTPNEGDLISDLTVGTLIERTYTYNLPAAIGDNDGSVAVKFEDLEVLVFVSETQKKIITGNEAALSIGPGFYISDATTVNEDCSLTFTPTVTFSNTFEDNVTAFTYTYNGHSYEYPSSVPAGQSVTVEMPAVVVETPESYNHVQETGSVAIISYTLNGDEESAPATEITFDVADVEIYTAAGHFVLDIAYDRYASETKAYWIGQENCSPLWTAPNMSDLQSTQPARHRWFTIDPANAGMYILRVIDTYGDGMLYVSSGSDHGFTLYTVDAAGNRTQLLHNDGSFTDKAEYFINVTNNGSGQYVGIDDVANLRFEVYPNPTTDRLSIECEQAISLVEVLDMAGRTVMSQNGNVNSISTQALANGVYMLRVVTEAGVSAQKFVKE